MSAGFISKRSFYLLSRAAAHTSKVFCVGGWSYFNFIMYFALQGGRSQLKVFLHKALKDGRSHFKVIQYFTLEGGCF
jgi:hypothetical protein